jgi:hypothetical protein
VYSRALFGAQVDHAFRRWLIATARFAVQNDNYVGSPRHDKTYALSTQITYKLSREVVAAGGIPSPVAEFH